MADELRKLEKELLEIDKKRSDLIIHIKELRKRNTAQKTIEQKGIKVADSPPSNSEEKIALFYTLFCCRRSVFPRRWINKRKSTKGYSPACQNEWTKGLCNKPKVKCSECKNCDFLPLDRKAVLKHLKG